MKSYLRFAAVFSLVLILLLSVSPAAAGATKKDVTGKIFPVSESYPPEFRTWITEQYIYHWRNERMEYQWITSDDRLNGWALVNNNGDSHYTADWVHIFSHIWAQWTIYAEPEYITPLWECTDNGEFDAQFNLAARGVCQGVGVNKGLELKLSISITDWSLGYMVIQGVLIDTDGK
jgi:hypothetical protein